MTTAKPRYEQQIGEQLDGVQFDEEQLAMLRSIKDETAFVESVRNIAMLYGCLYRGEAEELSAGEFTATLHDLKRSVATLGDKLETLPQSVDVALWRFSYEQDSARKMKDLMTLLNSLTDEIEKVLDEEPGTGKPGRKRAAANRYAAESLVRCFTSFGLPVTVNQWENSTPSPATSCLELIFACSGIRLSRSAIEEYLKPYKGKITPKFG